MIPLFHYDPITSEYLRASEARLDPIDGTPLVPRFATLIRPPVVGEKKVAVWIGDAWTTKPDYRETTYWLADGSEHTITEIGVKPPPDGLPKAPPPTLDARKEAAVREMRQIAKDVRAKAAAYAPHDRALGWVLKSFFAFTWQANERQPGEAFGAFAAVAQEGFALECDLTGEDPVAVRNKAIDKVGNFFRAYQLVEGMERLAEARLPAVTTGEELDEAIAQLRGLEAQALTKLETVIEGGNNA